MTTPSHPYLPGTAWAPKPRRGAVRIVRDRPTRLIVTMPAGAFNGWGADGTVWYVTTRNLNPVQCSARSFARWAGEQVQ